MQELVEGYVLVALEAKDRKTAYSAFLSVTKPRKPKAKRLPLAVKAFLLRVDSLPWDSDAAAAYAQLRTARETEGWPLGSMDMLIAAYSIAAGAILITSDKAFHQVEHHLTLEDWTKPLGH